MFIDSHCHFNSLSKIAREETASFCKDTFLCCFIDSSIDVNSSLASNALSQYYGFIYTSLGFHPFSAGIFCGEVIETYEALIKENKKIVAIGEIGLDYKADKSQEVQEEVFKAFIRLAKRHNLPVIIHNRLDPASDNNKKQPRVLEILGQFYPSFEKVIFHCFSYGPDILKPIIKKSGFVSFSLNVLRNKSEIIRSLEECPLENLLLETDSPYMKIKERNSTPLDIDKVYAKVSQAKGINEDKLKEQIVANIHRAFNFNPRSNT
ncbi:MAG: TatD family hydrolase [Candidatus Omnitrophica bacterium]|nr:TatD family hydrolase [Candidatus Omnitrophota bacterium]